MKSVLILYYIKISKKSSLYFPGYLDFLPSVVFLKPFTGSLAVYMIDFLFKTEYLSLPVNETGNFSCKILYKYVIITQIKSLMYKS